jgi:hypothetical protein
MGGGCYGGGYQRARSFLIKEERIALLKEYQDELDKEKQVYLNESKHLKQVNKLISSEYFISLTD